MRNAGLALLLWTTGIAQASTDCATIVAHDSASKAAVRCLLDHPELSRQRSPTRYAVFLGDGREPELEADHAVHLQADGTRVMVRQERDRGVRLGARVLVSIDWDQPSLTYVNPGSTIHDPPPAANARLLAMVDGKDRSRQTIALYNHRTGRPERVIDVQQPVRLLRFHNGHLLVGTDEGIGIWNTEGRRLWMARGVQPEGSMQVSANGEYLLVHQRRLYRSDNPAQVTLPVPAALIGNELFSLAHDGSLWGGPVRDYASMPPGPSDGVEDFRLGRGKSWAWADGRIHPEGATPAIAPRRRRPNEGALNQVVRLHSDAPGIVGAFVVGATGVAVDTDGLRDLDLAVARMLQAAPRYVEQFEVVEGDMVQRTVQSDQALRFVVGDDTVEVDAMPGVAERSVRPNRFASLPMAARGNRRVVRVTTAAGDAAAGARVYSTDGNVLVADRDGIVRPETRSSLWAIADATASKPGQGDVLVLDQPRQRCRVVDIDGGVLHAGAWCDRLDMGALLFENLGRPPSTTEPMRATLERVSAEEVHIRLVPRLVLTSVLDPASVSASYVVDSSGRTINATQRVDGLRPGPVTWWVEIDQDVWCMEFDMGALDTRIAPTFRRCAVQPKREAPVIDEQP